MVVKIRMCCDDEDDEVTGAWTGYIDLPVPTNCSKVSVLAGRISAGCKSSLMRP